MSTFLDEIVPHLIILPIVLPMLAGAAMLLLKESYIHTKMLLSIVASALGLCISIVLLYWVDQQAPEHAIRVYLAANWSAPFGITLVLDHLSALMLLLTSGIALSANLFASSAWHRAGVHFHPLFQFQLMGLSGAFLTGDLFNLFVFFEILLAASYGLALHGSGRARVGAGLHYIAINLAASSLLLIGMSMLYGITGTLNMADMAQRIMSIADTDRSLLHAAAGILAVAFLAKAAIWPLNFWLVPAYSAATAPISALFAIMTKVGFYALLRLWTLFFSADAGESAAFGANWLICTGLATMVFGTLGMLASQRLGYLASFSILISSGTLLASLGFNQPALTTAALYYMLSSSMAASMLFLLEDLIERWRNHGAVFAPHEKKDLAPFLGVDLRPKTIKEMDDNDIVLIGKPIPGAIALMGICFICCTLLVAGLPPLSGFVGKFALLHALLNTQGLQAASTNVPITNGMWWFMGLLIASGLASLIALTRAGIRHFWSANRDHITPPYVRLAEGVPIGALLIACIVLTLNADAVIAYTKTTAQSLHQPALYINTILTAPTIANP